MNGFGASAFAFLLVAGCGSAAERSADETGKPSADETGSPFDTSPVSQALDFGTFAPKNLVLLHVDTLRADSLPQWGSARDTMPRMVARSGWITVERAVASGTWTVPSTAALLSGRDLPYNGLRYFDTSGVVGTLEVPSLVESLHRAGFATALFSGNDLVLDPENGITSGFLHTRAVDEDPGNAEAAVEEALAWIESAVGADERFFVMLQPIDPHAPYTPSADDRGRWADPSVLPFSYDEGTEAQVAKLEIAMADAASDAERRAIAASARAAYDEQIPAVDRALDDLIAGLERLGRAEETLVIFASDHGESFYDGPPSYLGHGRATRKEVIHVPLGFWGASLTTAHVQCLASNMDVVPTALELLGVAGPGYTDGRSLLTGCREEAFSGVYEFRHGVESISAVSGLSLDAQVVHDCGTGERFAFDLNGDPGAAEARAVAEVAGGTRLSGELEAYVAWVLTALPHLRCGPG